MNLKSFISISLTLSAFYAFSSCSKEDLPLQEEVVCFSAQAPYNKTIRSTQQNIWHNYSDIGIFKNSNYENIYHYSVDPYTSTLTCQDAEPMKWSSEETKATFTAFAPKQELSNNHYIKYEIGEKPFLFAQQKDVNKGDWVHLNFKHLTAKFVIHYIFPGVPLEFIKTQFNNTDMGNGEINLLDGSITPTSTPSPISMFRQGNYDYIYFIPNTAKHNIQFTTTVKNNEKEYDKKTLNMNFKEQLQSGRTYYLEILIDRKGKIKYNSTL